ncbi:MAG: DNA gyrase C-terminal beta-propeller domain-containing protein, partial [Gemmatales bacterium]|nr:hypothetical protein [Gemmatales bacterium]MDW8176005.1 DNA gyrase C-terminal beta-propeller domain-containing protein [Gemmatales bacterium]
IRVNEVRITGRNTQGVRLIQVQEGDRVVSAAKIAREDLESNAETSSNGSPTPEQSSPESVPSNPADDAATAMDTNSPPNN